MSTDILQFDLPITEVISAVKSTLGQQNTLIVNAPTGAGKSTLLPLTLLDETWLKDKKIVMLEPRRLAAKTIAFRMAEMLGEKVGESIGYRIRFESAVSDKTRLEVVTEGILTRMLQSDNSISDIGLVIFDEFHERSIYADVALALTREAQEVLRSDLRIMIMSATLNIPKLEQLLNAPSVTSKGRLFPIEIKYGAGNDVYHLAEICAQTTITAVEENKQGDTLVFLPGQSEIKRCEEILKKQLREFEVVPLYGMLSPNEQQRAILPNRNGKRKIVIATNIAETSLTIQGITIVVDSGYQRKSTFDPNSGLSRLQTVQIDKDSATQRTGRAGRLQPGVCYRTWSKATHERLLEHRIPEIEEADLADLALNMAQWGVQNVNELTWLSPPPTGHYLQAIDLLEELEAIDEGKITALGKEMHRLPCHPRIAHMLLKATEFDLLEIACDVAALLEEKDPMAKDGNVDISLRVEKLQKLRNTNRLGGVWKRIDQIALNYKKLFSHKGKSVSVDPYDVGLLLAFAYPERIAHAKPGNNAQFKLANGKIAMIGHKDDLAHEPWITAANLDARDGLGKIFIAAPLNPEDLKPFLRKKEVVRWDSKLDAFIAADELRIGSIVLQSKPLKQVDPALKLKAINEAIAKNPEHLLNINDSFHQLINRINSYGKWNSNKEMELFSEEVLFKHKLEWLSPYLENVTDIDDLKKIDLTEALYHSLDWEFQKLLENEIPQKIAVPSGSSVKLKYSSNGEPPVLAVRIQELFGLLDTPAINNGKQKILLHLLSPGYKPVQVTQDLKSFWSNTYFEVRKELKRRYPKHHWPDHPEKEEPLRGVKKK